MEAAQDATAMNTLLTVHDAKDGNNERQGPLKALEEVAGSGDVEITLNRNMVAAALSKG